LRAARYGYKEISTPQWVTVTASFTKDDKPYGGGAFRLRGNEVMTLKIADPEVRYRVVGLEKGYDDAQAVPEEPWMDETWPPLSAPLRREHVACPMPPLQLPRIWSNER